jgi:hypothetical protein
MWLLSITAATVICLTPEIGAQETKESDSALSGKESLQENNDNPAKQPIIQKIAPWPQKQKSPKEEMIERLRKGLERYNDNKLPIPAFFTKKNQSLCSFSPINEGRIVPAFFILHQAILTKMIFYDNI